MVCFQQNFNICGFSKAYERLGISPRLQQRLLLWIRTWISHSETDYGANANANANGFNIVFNKIERMMKLAMICTVFQGP